MAALTVIAIFLMICPHGRLLVVESVIPRGNEPFGGRLV
jgi:hypothetical protein